MAGFRCALTLLVLAMLFISPMSIARAETPASRLDVQGCAEDLVQPQTVGGILNAELAGTEVPDEAQLVVRCEGDLVRLVVSRAPGDVPAERIIALEGSASETRPRLLALALAELVNMNFAAPVEDAEASTPLPAPVIVAPPAMPPPNANPRAPEGATIAAVAHATRFSAGVQDLWGLGLRAHVPLTSLLGLLLHAGGEGGTRTMSLGSTEARVASGGVLATARTLQGRFTLGCGTGARGGWMWLRGSTDQAQVVTGDVDGPWLAAVASAWATMDLFGRFGLLLAADAGWVIRGVSGRVAGETSYAADDLLLSASAGIVFSFPP